VAVELGEGDLPGELTDHDPRIADVGFPGIERPGGRRPPGLVAWMLLGQPTEKYVTSFEPP
jgi:hypothetical protein